MPCRLNNNQAVVHTLVQLLYSLKALREVTPLRNLNEISAVKTTVIIRQPVLADSPSQELEKQSVEWLNMIISLV